MSVAGPTTGCWTRHGTWKQAQRALDAARSAVVGELDARDVPRRSSGLGTAGWLGHHLGWSRARAGRCVATARKLRTLLPTVAAALADGRIQVEHADLLAGLAQSRVAPIVAVLQDELIALTVGVRFEHWAREARALIDLADVDGGHDPTPRADRLTLADGLSGELHLDVDLAGDNATTVRAALLEEADRRFRHHQQLRTADADHRMPRRTHLLAEALTELIRRGTAVRPGAKAPVTDATVVIHASEPLTGAGPPGALTPDGIRLPDGTTRRLLCDAALTAVIVDTLGVPLDLGTTVRLFTPAQHRAAMVRDGGCIHPGCDAPPAWTHLHHVQDAHVGGPTDLHNAASLCPGHHSLWHRPDWHATPDPHHPGRFTLTTPTGTILHTQQHGRPPPRE